MLTINVNGTPHTAYEGWHEVPLDAFIAYTQVADVVDPYWHLCGIDVPSLLPHLPQDTADRLGAGYQAIMAMEFKQWPPLTDIGRRSLGNYIQAKQLLKAKRHHAALATYYPDAGDNAQDGGMAWLEFMRAFIAYEQQWAWVSGLKFKGPSPNMAAMDGFGAMALVFELAQSVLDVDNVLNLEADVAMTYRAYKLQHATIVHNFNHDRAKKP